MSITDELRKEARGHLRYLYTSGQAKHLLAIADRIDEQNAEAQRRWMAELDAAREQSFNAGFDDGFASADDWLAQHEDAMREHGWVKLPKDADGKVIRIGDMVEWIDGDGSHAMEVTYLQLTSDGWYVGVKNYGLCGASELLRHHKQPTVEDVLREFAQAMNENIGMYTSEAIDADEWRDADNKTIAEYAAKLRLAEEVDG